MDDFAVSIVRIEAMRVASAYGFGDNPEEIAWRNMAAWARPKGFLNRPMTCVHLERRRQWQK